MLMYVVTFEEGDCEDIHYEYTFYTNEEDAFKQVYNYCLNSYETELARKTKRESKKRKGEWEAQNSRENFENEMADLKKEWDNYGIIDKKIDTDDFEKGLWAHVYGEYSGSIGMSIVEIN